MRLLILLFITTSLINSAYAASPDSIRPYHDFFRETYSEKKACCTTKNAAKSHKAATKKGNTKIADDYSRNLGRRR